MFLSIITINRNNAEGLKKTLDSVASQTCRDFEHIIIDGASTDDSVKVIKEYVASPAGKNVSYWISEPDKGVYNAMNKGIGHLGDSDYCLFLNSGDWLVDENVIERESNDHHTETIIYYDSINETKDGLIAVELPDNLSYRYFLSGKTIYHQNELIKTSCIKDHLYNENLKIFSDNEFNIRSILLDKVPYKHCKRKISVYEAEEGISSTQLSLCKNEQKQVLIELFGKEIYDDYQLLYDYETGYWGLLNKLRLFLENIATKTTRRK